jgi:DNA ligase-1
VKRLIKTSSLRDWVLERTGISPWLFSECYEAVGDLAETIALLLPSPTREIDISLHRCVEEKLLPLRELGEQEQKQVIFEAWINFPLSQRFVWNKLLTGGFRVGVSQRLVVRALAEWRGMDPSVIAHRMMGNWEPTPEFFRGLFSSDTSDSDISRPYPFFLAYPLESGPNSLGKTSAWQLEWKWDGIRAQLIRRRGEVFVWSRGEELVTERFPEIARSAQHLPDGTVLDGEIVAWRDGEVMTFSKLQRRIGRKTPSKRLLQEIPVVLIAFDILEELAMDVRGLPLSERRHFLDQLLGQSPEENIILSPKLDTGSWDEVRVLRSSSRARNVEGIMLKKRSSIYGVGRKKGPWWKWKVDPYTVDAVLIYAQRGHGRRASLYSDYTFGVWRQGQLVPFAKAYSGLTDEEIRRVDRFVRSNTVERFGPVRSVRPELVFELAFEDIQESSRHRSGVAVRFPRMLRWRTDKKPEDADSLDTIKALLP